MDEDEEIDPDSDPERILPGSVFGALEDLGPLR